MTGLYNQSPVDALPIDGPPRDAAVPGQAAVGDILLSVRQQLIDSNVWDIGTTYLSLSRHPRLNIYADSYGVLVPGQILADQRAAAGGGRSTTVLTLDLEVWAYHRLALDMAYQDTELLTNEAGLRAKVQQIANGLQTFWPTDNLGVALTVEPIRVKDADSPELYLKSPEWVAQALVYEVKYLAKLS